MKPVSEKINPFVSFSEVNVLEVDFFDDAWGFGQMFPEVLEALSMVETVAPDSMIDELFSRIKIGK